VGADAHARLGVHGAALDIKDIDHIMNSEHECALLGLSVNDAYGYLSLSVPQIGQTFLQ
jgi:hypothetical protein